MALLTLSYLKDYLGIPQDTTDGDAQLAALLASATATVEEYLGRKLEKERRTEYYHGTGQKTLTLRHRPVWTVHDVWVDHYGFYGVPADSFDNTTHKLTAGIDYVLHQDLQTPATTGPLSRSGLLVRMGTHWQEMGRVYYPGKVAPDIGPAFGNVKVDYTAGYDATTLPADLLAAIAMMVSMLKSSVPTGRVLESERIGDYSYTILTGRMMQGTHPVFGSLEKILARYREVSF